MPTIVDCKNHRRFILCGSVERLLVGTMDMMSEFTYWRCYLSVKVNCAFVYEVQLWRQSCSSPTIDALFRAGQPSYFRQAYCIGWAKFAIDAFHCRRKWIVSLFQVRALMSEVKNVETFKKKLTDQLELYEQTKSVYDLNKLGYPSPWYLN